MRFQINNSLIFDEEAMTIFTRQGGAIGEPMPDEGGLQAKLGSIHSRCLAYLCKRYLENQSIISKKELFFAGWEKHGLVSSNNSLAQTIFQLRRSLKIFDLDSAIVTVPRVGFKLKGLEVKLLSKNNAQPAAHPIKLAIHQVEAGFLRTHVQPISWSPPLSISLSTSLGLVLLLLTLLHCTSLFNG